MRATNGALAASRHRYIRSSDILFAIIEKCIMQYFTRAQSAQHWKRLILHQKSPRARIKRNKAALLMGIRKNQPDARGDEEGRRATSDERRGAGTTHRRSAAAQHRRPINDEHSLNGTVRYGRLLIHATYSCFALAID
eukprot:scaffold84772_cov41-Attheya_sp.AAC.2